MILASIWDVIRVPFGYLLDILYRLTNNYGVAMILFAILVKVILLPISAKSRKSSMAMSRLTPKVQEIQTKYANDPQKQNEMLQSLYRESGVSMTGGCLWGIVPLLILLPLYTVVRQPITYMLHESAEVSQQIVDIIKAGLPSLFSGNSFYDQMVAVPHIAEFAEQIKTAIPTISENTLQGVNFSFLGIDLAAVPQFNIFGWNAYDWAHIGLFLLPILSAASQVLSMIVSQKINDSVVTNKDGVQDKETAKNSSTNKSMKIMMWTMPLMSLWIGFTICGALSLYWLIQGVVSIALDSWVTLHYRKIYEEEDAARLKLALEREKEEAEKERVRAERRAANPNGITENTSKKKLQQKVQREQEAAKAAAAKEYAAKKGIVEEEDEDVTTVRSGIPSRPNCKGRAYNPNRYRNNTEE